MKKLLLILLCTTYTVISYAQTIGITEVTSIEQKVVVYETNSTKLKQYHLELPILKRDWELKIQKLDIEIASLIKERNGIIEDMKVGARCSQCNRWKSEFEKKGESFEKHLGDVKGYAIPSTTEEISSKRKEYDEKIAIKRVQLQNLKKGDDAYLKRLREIERLDEEQQKVCPQITQLSKTYETKVLNNGKAKHKTWAIDMVNVAINILIAENTISISKARALRYAKEFEEERRLINEKVSLKNQEDQEKKKNKSEQNEAKIERLSLDKEENKIIKQKNIGPLSQELQEIEAELKQNGYKMTDSLKLIFENSKAKLQKKILLLNTEIKDFEKVKDDEILILIAENKKLFDEIFQLRVDLPKLQNEAVNLRKPIFDAKIQEAKHAEANAVLTMVNSKKIYTEKVNKYKQDYGQFSNLVSSESNRMAAAGRKINCSVWNNTNGMLTAHWNTLFSCVDYLVTMVKPKPEAVFSANCTTEFIPDLNRYKLFLDALSIEDRNVL